MGRITARLRVRPSDAGLTMVELLVASAMGIVVLAGVGSMLVGAMTSQPEVSERAQAVSKARWVMERLTREIRNGVAVDEATTSKVVFRTYVRRTACGGTTIPASTVSAIECRVEYACTTSACTRAERAPTAASGGTPQPIVSGIDDSNVFSYSPVSSPVASITFIGITLHFPNPTGPADLTVSDGASLRNATLGG
jgi:hypothetical protein